MFNNFEISTLSRIQYNPVCRLVCRVVNHSVHSGGHNDPLI